MTEETANPQGSESQPIDNIEAAFDTYLNRQAQPVEATSEEEQPEEKAKPETEEEPSGEEQRYTVKINGEDKEVTLDELLKGYSMEADYRVKSSQVAEQRREAQALAQQAQAERQQYAQALQMYQQQLVQMQPPPPDPAMIESDPVGYLRQQQAYSAWQGQMQRTAQEQHALSQRMQAEQEQAQAKRLQSETDALLAAIPEWKDEAKANAGKAELTVFLQKLGYSQDEIASAQDHRAIVMARKAMLYDQMVSKQKVAADKVAKLPPKTVQRPGSGEISPTDGRLRVMQNLKKSGSIDDGAAAFAAFLG